MGQAPPRASARPASHDSDLPFHQRQWKLTRDVTRMRFTDRVAIITGAARGIGLAAAKRLGSEGARVVIADLNGEKAQAAARAVTEAGAPDVLASPCDVSKEDQVNATVQSTLRKFGRLDIVVNNAGLMIFKKLEEHEESDWLKVLQVDLLGAFFLDRKSVV